MMFTADDTRTTMRPSTRRTSSRLSAKSEVLTEQVRDDADTEQRRFVHPESKRRRKQGPEGIVGRGDSISPGCSNPYEQFFANTVAELHAAVIKRLRNTDMNKVTRSCAEVSVKLLDTGQTGISLSGDWEMLCEARRRITEILHPPLLLELDDGDQEDPHASDDEDKPQSSAQLSVQARSVKRVCKTHPSTATDKDLGALDKKKQFQCNHCSNKFSDVRQFTRHMTVVHSGQALSASKVSTAGKSTRPYVCGVCGKGFSTSSYRKDHENVHSGREPYICKVCGKSFWAQCHLWKHAQSHKKKTHQCLICKKRFTFRAGLTAHMVKHTRSGKHQCETCRRVYTQRQTLLRHVCKVDRQIQASDNRKPNTTTGPATSNKTTAAINLIGELNKLSEGTAEPLRQRNADHQALMSAEPVRETICDSLADYCTPTAGVTTVDRTIDDSRTESSPLIVSLPHTDSNVTSPPTNRRTTRSSRKPKHVPTDSPLSCIHCPEKFRTKAELVKHERFHHNSGSSKQPLEPDGEMTEVSELSTTEFRVMADKRGVRWYECRVCLLTGTRRFRMAAHYRVSHTENGGVPFNMIVKPSDENASVAEQSRINNTIEQAQRTSTEENSVRRPPKMSRLQLKHPEKATEECHKCGYKTSVAGLRNHMRTQHTKYLYQCQVCTKSFSTLFALRSHFRGHSDGNLTTDGKPKVEPGTEYACEKCGKTFNRNVDLVHHKKLGTSCSDKPPDPRQYNPPFSEGKYLCEVCGYSALQRVHVVQHHARRHAPRDFHCDQCSLSFAYERDLNNHRSVSHVEQKTHKCGICGKCFASSKYLNSHQQRHEKVKKHFCPVCNKGFLEKYRMTQHVETHKAAGDRQKLFSCRVCGKGFTTNSYRNDHENIHSGRQPYSCKECGKTLKAQCHMWKHMQLHHADKTHICPVCGKSFRFKAGLTAHVVTHTRSGQHRCEACGKVYTQRQTLQRHVCKSGTVSTALTTPGQTQDAANATPEVYLQDTLDGPDVNTAGVYTQSITDTADSALDMEPEASTQQNVYMCSECNEIFYDWNEVNDHLLTHTAVMTTTQALMEVGDDGNFTIQVLHTTEDSVPQGDETNTAVVNIIDPDVMQHEGQDVTTAVISGPDITESVSQDTQSNVSISNVTQSGGQDLTSAVVSESDIMRPVVQDTQSNVVLVSGMTQDVRQDPTSTAVSESDIMGPVVQDTQSNVVLVSGMTQDVRQDPTSTAVSESDIMGPVVQDTQSNVVLVSGMTQDVRQDPTSTAVSESDIMGPVVQDTQSNVVLVSGMTQSVGQDLTSGVVSVSDVTESVVHDTQSAVVSMSDITQRVSPNTESAVVSMSDMTHSDGGVPVSMEGIPGNGIETAAGDWSILVNAPPTDKQLNIEDTGTTTPVVFIDTQSII